MPTLLLGQGQDLSSDSLPVNEACGVSLTHKKASHAPEARPLEDEGVVGTTTQEAGRCKVERGE